MRPVFPIFHDELTSVEIEEGYTTNRNARLWWRYAITAVIKSNREKRGWLTAFRVPRSTLEEMERRFVPLFLKYSADVSRIEEEEELQLRHAVESVDLEVLRVRC